MTRTVSHPVAAIVIEYNSGPLLNQAVDSILNQEYPVEAITIVANSPVNSSSVEELDPRVRVIEGDNVGYGAAANRGVRETPPACDIMVMNPDVVLLRDGLRRIVAALERKSDVGAVGPRLLWSAKGPVQRAGSRFPSPLDELIQQTRLRNTRVGRRRLRRLWMGEWDRQVSRHVDVLSGACMLFRREAFDDIGGFDETYFLYFEEVDLCKRLDRAGWGRWYCADALASHLSGGSSGDVARRYYIESRRRYMLTHHNTAYALAVEAMLRGYESIRIQRSDGDFATAEARRRRMINETNLDRYR